MNLELETWNLRCGSAERIEVEPTKIVTNYESRVTNYGSYTTEGANHGWS